jgi:hypothetical protein
MLLAKEKFSVAVMTIRKPTFRARRSPIVAEGAARTTKKLNANQTLTNAKTLAVDTMKTTVVTGNPHIERSQEVCLHPLLG